MTRVLIFVFSALTVLSACSAREETSAEISSNTVYLASQERSIQYVDSVPVMSEDVTVFAVQPVEEPYYDTIYNTSSLVLSIPESDSIRIYSLPDFQSNAFLTEENDGVLLNVPEFNDIYTFRQVDDNAVVLEKPGDKQSYVTYFHALPVTAGDLASDELVGTTWRISNGQIDQVTFFAEDSCIFRFPWEARNPDGPYSSLHSGKWQLREVDGRTFLIMYSYDMAGPDGNIFTTHFIRSADPGMISSEVYINKTGSLNQPVSRLTPQWQKQAVPSTGIAQNQYVSLIGTWKSTTYPFATGYEHSDRYDTIVNTDHTIVLDENGRYSEEISCTVVLQGKRTDYAKAINGTWSFDPAGFYIYLKPAEGNAQLISIEEMDGQTLILNVERNGFENPRFQDRIQEIFTKQDGT